MKKLITLGLAAGLSFLVPEISESHPRYSVESHAIDTLATEMDSRGYKIDSLLSSSKFKVHENIAKIFINSAKRQKQIKKQNSQLSEHSKKLRFDRQYKWYKSRLGFEDKADSIGVFMERHSQTLRRVEQAYMIPKELVSAVIGIESDFGKNNGKYNPFNALVSVYISGERRDFALSQLEELITYCQDNKRDVFDLKSSYAGAIGGAQFMPYSLNRWAIGKDENNIDNNLLSIANYLNYFKGKTSDTEELILRYNPSKLYARAVIELSEITKK